MLRSRLDDGQTSGQIIQRSLREPFKLLTNPACVGYAALSSVAYGYQYLGLAMMDSTLRKAFGDEILFGRWLLVGLVLGSIFPLLLAMVADYAVEVNSRRLFICRITFGTLVIVVGMLMSGWFPKNDYVAAGTLVMCGFMLM